MAGTAAKATGTRIGCDNAVGATCTEAADGTVTFGTITPLPGLIKMTVNPNASTDTLFFDDGPGDTAASLGKIEVEIEKNALSIAEKVFLLGHVTDANGGLVYGGSDVPPWVAIGFRTLKSNGMYKYMWIYKGKFCDSEDANETKGDSISFQTDTIKGNFVKLAKAVTVGGKSIKPYKYELDEEFATANPALIAKWFTAVPMPSDTVVA